VGFLNQLGRILFGTTPKLFCQLRQILFGTIPKLFRTAPETSEYWGNSCIFIDSLVLSVSLLECVNVGFFNQLGRILFGTTPKLFCQLRQILFGTIPKLFRTARNPIDFLGAYLLLATARSAGNGRGTTTYSYYGTSAVFIEC